MKKYNWLLTGCMFCCVYSGGGKADTLVKDHFKIEEEWKRTLEKSAFIKSGLDRLNHEYYQYESVGLGGTVMRVDPWGFGYHRAPGVVAETPFKHQHRPYFGNEYWWDKEGHRFNPFNIMSGYGTLFNPGTITGFNHHLDIQTGMLEINLNLNVDGHSFSTKRNVFVTPEGVLVIRVQDAGAPSPLQLKVEVEPDIRIYNNQGIYAKPHAKWLGTTITKQVSGTTLGGVVTATRPGTSTAALAVAVGSESGVRVLGKNDVYSSAKPDGTLIFYIAPASSFKPGTASDPGAHAWKAAYAARQKGYENLLRETAEWWQDFFGRSSISIPDESVAKLYAQSLYYHGVYFGETSIPPGCNSTDIESFGGAVCTEYDLTFSQLAMVYTDHIDEAKNVADWLYEILPKARENATKGLKHHDVQKKYATGAKYTTLMGYDGALCVQPTVGEGTNLHSNYPGANAAVMALSYLDFSDDNSYKQAALDILKSTTEVSLADLAFDDRAKAYYCQYSPSTVQQASALMGYSESVKRGIADPGWSKYEGRILIPITTLNNDSLIAGGVESNAQEGVGDATWLQHIWWDNVIKKDNPLVLPSYKNSAKSTTGNYVFNNGWMGVVASKLYLGNDALSWLENFQKPDILYDQTCFTESKGYYNLTPEIGAHGAYICNLAQMFIDPDSDKQIDIFPAIPDAWDHKKLAFANLLTKGALAVSGERDLRGTKITITNNSGSTRERQIKIKIPRATRVEGERSPVAQDGFIIINISLLPGETKKFEYRFSPA